MGNPQVRGSPRGFSRALERPLVLAPEEAQRIIIISFFKCHLAPT